VTAFYNEIDPFAAAWLRRLISRGLIAPGVVDERSIEELEPEELEPFSQVHLFAGIGVWSHALRRAGWPDDRPVWTGSCPCQPFSVAGSKKGLDDERHLWPSFSALLAERCPPTVFGEQVAGTDGLDWLDLVFADLENQGYAVGAADLSAASVGAPHLRQRLYFVANNNRKGPLEQPSRAAYEAWTLGDESSRCDKLRELADGEIERRGKERADRGGGHSRDGAQGWRPGLDSSREDGQLADAADRDGRGGGGARDDLADARREGPQGRGAECRLAESAGKVQTCGGHGDGGMGNADGGGESEVGGIPVGTKPTPDGDLVSFWDSPDWVLCDDPSGTRWRPVEPGAFPLAHGVAGRVGRLRGYGNAIVGPLASEFIRAFLETQELG